MVKAVGELALAGVGIIPAMGPSSGYTDMVPFNPFLKRRRKGTAGQEDFQRLKTLNPLGVSFYEVSVLKMSDRKV